MAVDVSKYGGIIKYEFTPRNCYSIYYRNGFIEQSYHP